MSNCVEKATAFFDKKLVTALDQYYRHYIIDRQGSLAIKKIQKSNIKSDEVNAPNLELCKSPKKLGGNVINHTC